MLSYMVGMLVGALITYYGSQILTEHDTSFLAHDRTELIRFVDLGPALYDAIDTATNHACDVDRVHEIADYILVHIIQHNRK